MPAGLSNHECDFVSSLSPWGESARRAGEGLREWRSLPGNPPGRYASDPPARGRVRWMSHKFVQS